MKSILVLTIIIISLLSCNRAKKDRIEETNISSIKSSTSNTDTIRTKELLKQISITSIKLGDFELLEDQLKSNWLGNTPASLEEIFKAEKRLNIVLPQDYKEFLKQCNGFHASSTVEPTFHKVDKIDYLKNIDPELIKIWNETGNNEEGKLLEKSILIAGIDEEQYFLIIPPNDAKSPWKYWKFASWIPGEEEYPDLLSYWNDVLKFNEGQLKKK
jgi:hypothetical protein